jgi:hypothetical protein
MMEDFLSALLESKRCHSANLVDDNARSSSSSASLHKTLPISMGAVSSVPRNHLSSNLPRRRSAEDRWTAASPGGLIRQRSAPASSADSLLVVPTRMAALPPKHRSKSPERRRGASTKDPKQPNNSDAIKLSQLDQTMDLMDDFWEKSSWSAVLEKKTNVPLLQADGEMSLTPSSVLLQNMLSSIGASETSSTTMKQAYPIDATPVKLNKDQLDKMKTMASLPAVELLKNKQQLQVVGRKNRSSMASPLLSNAFAASQSTT